MVRLAGRSALIQDDWRDGERRRQYNRKSRLDSAEHVSIVPHPSACKLSAAQPRFIHLVMMKAALRKMDDHEQHDGQQEPEDPDRLPTDA